MHFTASALVVHPDSGRVLLRWHQRMRMWLQVGGHGDPGEGDPLAIALREAHEETGLPDLRPWPDDAIRHAVLCNVPSGNGEPAHKHADLRYFLATGARRTRHLRALARCCAGSPWTRRAPSSAATTSATPWTALRTCCARRRSGYTSKAHHWSSDSTVYPWSSGMSSRLAQARMSSATARIWSGVYNQVQEKVCCSIRAIASASVRVLRTGTGSSRRAVARPLR